MAISISAHVTSGYSPLHVSCQISGATTTQLLEDDWWWTADDATEDDAHGPWVGFCLEGSGTKTITCYHRAQSDGTLNTYTQDITLTGEDAQFPTTATVCISNDTDHTGAPTGADTVDSITSWATVATYLTSGKRVLLKAGDTFTGTVDEDIGDINGNVMLGSYGTLTTLDADTGIAANAPVVEITVAGQGGLTFKSNTNSGLLKIRDVTFTNSAAESDTAASAVGVDEETPGGFTVLRFKCSGWRRGIVMSYGAAGAPTNADHGFFSCDLSAQAPTAETYGLRDSASYMSIVNCDISADTTVGHCIRIPRVEDLYLAKNRVTDGSNLKHQLKLHNVGHATQTYSERINLDRNKWSAFTADWPVAIMPQDTGSPLEHIRYVVIDGDEFEASAASTSSNYLIYLQAEGVRVRNVTAIDNHDGSNIYCVVSPIRRATGTGHQVCSDIKVENCSAYVSHGDHTSVNMVEAVTADVSDAIEVTNCLVYAPNETTVNMTTGTATFTESNCQTTDPSYTDAASGDLTLTAALAGTRTTALRDQTGRLRVGTFDRGAFAFYGACMVIPQKLRAYRRKLRT